MLKKLYAYLYSFALNTEGVTGIEYGFILGSVGVSVMTGAFIVGEDISSVFETLSSYMDGGMTSEVN